MTNEDLRPPIVKVTDDYELDEETFMNILCHEMLHYYLMCLHFDEGGIQAQMTFPKTSNDTS